MCTAKTDKESADSQDDGSLILATQCILIILRWCIKPGSRPNTRHSLFSRQTEAFINMALSPRLGQVYQPNAECTPISIDPDHTSGVNAFLSHTRETMQIPDGVHGGYLRAEWPRYISRTVYEPVTPVSTPTAAQGASDVQSLTPSNSQEGVQETVPTLPANASRYTISSVSNLPATSTAASISRVHRQTYVIKYRSPSIRVYLPPSPVAER